MAEPENTSHSRLLELFILCFRLGVTAFGGPAVHIAMLEQEVVEKRHWLTHEEFLDLLGITNLIPGPNSTEMVIHVGHRRAGFGYVDRRPRVYFPRRRHRHPMCVGVHDLWEPTPGRRHFNRCKTCRAHHHPTSLLDVMEKGRENAFPRGT